MTPNEIESLRIAIAEECGWKFEKGTFNHLIDEGKSDAWHKAGHPSILIDYGGQLPFYTTSLDAIQAAAMERFNSLELAYLFEGELLVIKAETKTPFQHQLTALDWCIAFARTAKIWRYKQL